MPEKWNVPLRGVAGRGWAAVAVSQGERRAELKSGRRM